ncbi:hypothetical protein BH23BAC1_BH23BAC1_50640 [soil metagenome]
MIFTGEAFLFQKLLIKAEREKPVFCVGWILMGSKHINPEVNQVPLPFLEPFNGTEVLTPHLHLYVEGYGEKWAVPADLFLQINQKDRFEIMMVFFKYCNVTEIPYIPKTLFI